MARPKKSLLVLVGALMMQPVIAANNTNNKNKPAAAYYRYTMPDGRTEVGRQVPANAVDAGYQVLDKRMRVIRQIKPAPTLAELAKKQEINNRRDSDDRLLQTFATSKDAERARDRKIAALDVIVNISHGNILRLNLEYETLAALAAAKMRRGEPIPEHVQLNMTSIERQILEAQTHIQTKENEKTTIFNSYQPDIERLQQLEGKSVDN